MCHCSFGTNRRCQLLCKQDLTHVPTSAIHLKIYYLTTFHPTTYCLSRGQIAARLLSIRIAGEVKSFWFSPGCPQRSALGTNIISKDKVAVQGCPLVTTIDHRSIFLSRQPNWKKGSLAGEAPRVSTPLGTSPKSRRPEDVQFDEIDRAGAPGWCSHAERCVMGAARRPCRARWRKQHLHMDVPRSRSYWRAKHKEMLRREITVGKKTGLHGKATDQPDPPTTALPATRKFRWRASLQAEDWMTLGPSLRKWQLRARTLSASSPRLIRLTWYKQSACTNATGN